MNAAVTDETEVTLVVGHRGGLVVMNSYGNAEVEPHWTALTPDEARALARKLLDSADAAEQDQRPKV